MSPSRDTARPASPTACDAGACRLPACAAGDCAITPGGLCGVLLLLTRVALGGLMAFAGYMKLGFNVVPGIDTMGPLNSYILIGKFVDLPASVQSLGAFVLPWVELIAGLLLVLGLWARGAALVVLLLMLAFIAGIASLMMRGVNEPCTCFGPIAFLCPAGSPMGWCHVLRNAGFAAAAIVVMGWGPGWLGFERRRSA